MNRPIRFSEGEYYHIYNRGVERREIFLDSADRRRFQELLYVCNGDKSVTIRNFRKAYPGDRLFSVPSDEIGDPITSVGAYCLMPNHFHILLRSSKDGGISTYLQKITTAYTMYFNKRYERVGALFQGTFKAEHVHKDEHLKYLYAYIHLNPVKRRDFGIPEDSPDRGSREREAAMDFLGSYRYSSYLDLAGKGGGREEEAILSPEVFPEYFTEPHDFDVLLRDWIELGSTFEKAQRHERPIPKAVQG